MTSPLKSAHPHAAGDSRPLSWAALAAYALMVAALQLPWLTYAPVTAQAATTMGVSDGAVGDLAVVVALLYVVLGLPAGRWLDRRYNGTLVVGTALAVGGTLLRAVDPSSYQVALVGQIIFAAGAPLVLNAVTKLPARHFFGSRRTAAIAVVSAAQFLGILLAAATGPMLVGDDVTLLVRVHAVVLVVVGAVFLASLAVKGPLRVEPTVPSLRMVVSHPQLRLLAAQMFIGLGVFNCVATWTDTIEGDLGHDIPAGLVITVMTAAGILGAALLPVLAARSSRRRLTLIVASVGTTLGVPLTLLSGLPLVAGALAALTGFVLMAGLPIALDWSEIIVGPEQAGSTAAVLLVAGNIGGAVFVIVVQQFLASPLLAVLVITILTAPWIVLATRQREPMETAPRTEVGVA